MSETQIIGLIIGAVCGFVLALVVVSPRWRYLGGGYAYAEGGASNLGGCALEVFLTGLGGLFGFLAGGFF